MADSTRPLRLGLLGGDGIGPEVIGVCEEILGRLSPATETVNLEVGFGCFETSGTALPPATLDALASCDGALLGAVGSPSYRVEGYQSPVIELRKRFDLYANLRPLLSVGPEPHPRVDMIVVRENTEGLYCGREFMVGEGRDAVATAERQISHAATERIVRTACEVAESRAAQGRNALLTIVHKANVLRVTDGLFREVAFAVASEFPGLEVEEQLVDSMAYRMVREPGRYGVLVAPNLYGDVLSDLGAALVGGLGLVPSANVGERFVMAEPVHGSAPDIAGQGVANPLATLKALVMLLEHLGEHRAAETLEAAVTSVQLSGPYPGDMGGNASMSEVAGAVTERLEG